MALDPTIAAQLDAIASGLFAASRALIDLRATLDPPPPPPPPPPPTSTQIAIGSIKYIRVDATTCRADYTLTGTLERATRLAVQVVATPAASWWQEFPAPTALSGSVTFKVPGTAGGLAHFHIWDNGTTPAPHWVIAGNVPFAANPPGPPPPPPPPPPPGTDRLGFALDARSQPVFALDGKPTVLLGASASGQHGYWGGGLKAAGHSGSWAGWGWNMVRVFEQDPGGGECSSCPDANNPETTAQIVDEYTRAGIVVVLDYHQFDFGREYGPAQRDKMIARWTPWAQQFGTNPLVIFELANEPEATFHGYDHGARNDDEARLMMYDRWLAAFGPVIDAIRATGARNLIMVDDCQAGQGADNYWTVAPATGSATIAVGRQLVDRDPLHRVCFSFHGYDEWGWGGPGEEHSDCSTRYTDAQRDARLVDYVTRCYAATGVPLYCGEFGWRIGDSPLTGSGYHWPFTTCGSRTLRGQQCVTRAGRALSLSTAEWIGFQMTMNGNNGFDHTRLTACGQDYDAYCLAMRNGPLATTELPPTSAAQSAPGSDTDTAARTPYGLRADDPVGALRMARPERNARPIWTNAAGLTYHPWLA